MESPAPLPFDQISPEDQAARLLFFREHGFTSVRRLAAAVELPVERVENLMCRALATLLRGYPPEQLCATFTLTPEQLDRAAKAPAFGQAFRPIGEWRWRRPGAPEEFAEPEPVEGWLAELAEAQAVAQAELSDSAA